MTSDLSIVKTAEVNKLSRPKAMTIGHQHHRGISMPPTVLPSGVHDPFNFRFRQVLAGSQVGVRRPPRRDCSFYDGWRDQLQVCFRHAVGPHSPNDCSDKEHSMDSL